MTLDETVALAKEIGLSSYVHVNGAVPLLYFAKSVAEREREANEKVIRQLVEALENSSDLIFKDVRLSHTRNLALQLGRDWLGITEGGSNAD